MSLYPKQLQYFDESTAFRTSDGERVVYSGGFTPGSDITVNGVLVAISDLLYGIDISGATHVTRTRDRFRLFADAFGDEVVFPAATPIASPQAVNELIAVLRVLWEIRHTRGTKATPKTGYATAVLT